MAASRFRFDPALAFIFDKLKEENATLPPDEQMGLDSYCRKYGILAPQHWEAITRFETPFSDLADGGAGLTGEERTEET
jgi:hypothetical protein